MGLNYFLLFSRLKAIFLQSFTALAAVAGCLVALFAQSAGQAAAAGIILPFTGNFNQKTHYFK